jgi:two-component system, sensor histidine kinase and response regulator
MSNRNTPDGLESPELLPLGAAEILGDDFGRLLRLAGKGLGVAQIWVLHRATGQIRALAALRGDPSALPSEAIAPWVDAVLAQKGEILVVEDCLEDRRFPSGSRSAEAGGCAGLGTVLSSPQGREIGILFVLGESPRAWMSEDMETFRDTAESATRLILRAVQFQKDAEGGVLWRHWQAFAAALPGVLSLKDEEGRILYLSPNAEKLFGRPLSEMVGRRDRDWLPEPVARRMESNDLLVLESTHASQTFEALPDGAGRNRHCLVVRFMVEDSSLGRLLGAVFLDRTEQKESEDELRHSEELFRQLAELAPVGIFKTNPEGRCVYVNEEWCRFTGYSAQRALGDIWPAMVYFGSPEIYARWCEASREGRGFSAEFSFERLDGSRVWAQGHTVPLKNGGGRVIGHIGVFEDITVHKEAEEHSEKARVAAEQANEAKSRFLANMSHEVRTPLNAIIGINEMLLDGELDAETRGLVGTMQASAGELLEIVNNILDFSKIEAGQVDAERIDFDLPALLEEVLQLHAGRASGKGLVLESEVDPGTPLQLRGDPVRLKQILNNLVGNAVKFSDHGRILISVGVDHESDAGLWLRFRVVDFGVGIAPEALDRIFEPFTQADNSTTRRFGGTGLGLSICRQLAELMGGRIGVQSELGFGSTFWFTVRLESGSSPDSVVAPHPRKSEAPLRVLVAEADSVSRLVFMQQLRIKGCFPKGAENGKKVLEMCSAENFDLLLLDCHMPIMDGFATAEEIRRRESPQHRVLILGMGTQKEGEGRDRCISSGMDGYLRKPFSVGDLFEAIRRLAGAGAIPGEWLEGEAGATGC